MQIAEWLTIGFGPADGGYASVFVGWTGFYAAFVLLALVWIEIQLATTLRNRDAGVRRARRGVVLPLVRRRDRRPDLDRPLPRMMVADFLAAALVTLFLPIAALVLLIVWWAVVAHRASRRKTD